MGEILSTEELTKEVLDGNITFDKWEKCEMDLKKNQNPTELRFNQLIIFLDDQSKPVCHKPKIKDIDIIADTLKATILGSLPYKKLINDKTIPDFASKHRIQDKVKILFENKRINLDQIIDKQDTIDKVKINQLYDNWGKDIDLTQKGELLKKDSIARFGLEIDDLHDEKKVKEKLIRSLRTNHIKIALISQYKQTWINKGYSEGDLLKTWSLWPGENLTLEFHFWDKSTFKRENELLSEQNLSYSSSFTQRDSLQLLDELSKQKNFNGNLKADVSVPIEGATVGIGGGVGVSNDVNTKIQDTITKTTEDITQISNSFKQTRKARIEETREVGREEKQTRVIANTNRCHLLHISFFEVLVNYLVTTKFEKYVPCVLIDIPEKYCLPISSVKLPVLGKFKLKITPEYLLCKEHILKNALIDRTFLAGFEGAKKLRELEELQDIIKKNTLKEKPNLPNDNQPNNQQSEDDKFMDYIKKILEAYSKIDNGASRVIKAMKDEWSLLALTGGVIPYLVSVNIQIEGDNIDAWRKFLAYLQLQSNRNAVNSIKALQGLDTSFSIEGQSPKQALSDFFNSVTVNDFEGDLVETGIENALESINFPSAVADVISVIAEYLVFGGLPFVADLIKDDAGLSNAVTSAFQYYLNATQTQAGRPISTLPTNTSTELTEPTLVDELKKYFDLNELAVAQVEFDRLVCHLKSNEIYYNQVLFKAVHPDERFRILRKLQIQNFVGNEIIDFFDNQIAFPILDKTMFMNGSCFDGISDQALKVLKAKPIDPKVANISQTIITLPTPGTRTHLKLDDCIGCEEYIVESRKIDLRQQRAKANKEEAEAREIEAKAKYLEKETERVALRLGSTPPDLTDAFTRTINVS